LDDFDGPERLASSSSTPKKQAKIKHSKMQTKNPVQASVFAKLVMFTQVLKRVGGGKSCPPAQ